MVSDGDGNILLGVDTGGTFTDLVLYRGGAITVHKVLSTPEAPERAILEGIRDLGVAGAALAVVHGSTVATNAVLEGKLARTVLITNRGFGDILTLGRQARADLYALQPPRPAPPVPRELCLETGGRLGAAGEVVEPLPAAEVAALAKAVERLAPEAVAITLLFSFLDGRFEQRIAEALPPGLSVSRSAEVLPEYGEYERAVATWLNAAVGPRVEGYLTRLGAGLPRGRVAVMQSSGETVAARQAGGRAVHMLLSGPAGGLAGAGFVGRLAGEARLLSFDMGGTSTDVALIEGAPRLTTEGKVGGYPVGVPMVDMHTIGAGGGSIAQVDAGGMLQVGPESAGADPGPACYGRGGARPTVTDANLVLGRLLPGAFLGGRLELDVAAARRALGALGAALGRSAEEAAEGVIRVANEHMARALRVISVQRGIDPRSFALASFGGAGGLHVCALAEALGMDRALVPVHAGVLSALGMLATRPGRQLSLTRLGLLEALSEAEIEAGIAGLVEQGGRALADEGIPRERLRVRPSLDLRYRGQSYTLNVPWTNVGDSSRAFEAQHEARYGHRMSVPVELVNLRVALEGPPVAFGLEPAGARSAAGPAGQARVHGIADPVPVYRREHLGAGQGLKGPALITEALATTWLAPGWDGRSDSFGNLILQRSA